MVSGTWWQRIKVVVLAGCTLTGAAASAHAAWDGGRWGEAKWDAATDGGAPSTPPTDGLVNQRYHEGRTPSGTTVVTTLAGLGGRPTSGAFSEISWLPAPSSVAPARGQGGQVYEMPYGAITFTADQIPHGATVTVRLTFATRLPDGTVYMKQDADGEWSVYDRASVSGNSILVTLTDGGAGDSDGRVNGRIVDPGGPGIPVPAGAPGGGGSGGGGAGGGGAGTASDWRLVAIPGKLPFKPDVPPNTIVSMEAFLIGVNPEDGAPVSYYPDGSEGFTMRGSRVRSFLNLDGTMIETVRVADLHACSAFALKQGKGTGTTTKGPSFMIDPAFAPVAMPQGWSLVTFLGPEIHENIDALIVVGTQGGSRAWFRGAPGNNLNPADLEGRAVFAYFRQGVSNWRCGRPGA